MALEADVVNRAAQLYGIAASELKPLRGGLANLVYGFSKGGRRYVLRLTPPNEDVGLPEMKAILTWMHFLAAHGGLVPGPAASERGEWVEVIEQAGQRYLATALEQARGILSETLSPGQWTEALYESLGRTVGRLHALAKDYAPGAALKRPDWDAGGNVFTDARRLEPSQAAIAEKYAEVMGRIAGLPKDRDGYGMIHADLHFGNFFVDPESGVITFFDFDDCCYGWYVMDVAMLVFDSVVLYAGEDKDTFARRFLQSFLKGYRPENRLDAFWLRQMPDFLKLLEIGAYAEAYKFYEAGDAGEWGRKFMPGRKARIENGVPYLNVDFERC